MMTVEDRDVAVMGATDLEQSANGVVLRISATGIASEKRARYISEDISDRLVGARASTLPGAPSSFDYQILELGGGTRVLGSRLDAFEVERTRDHLADGDDGFSLFVALSGSLLVEQNGHRVDVARGAGVLVSHGRPILTRCPQTRFAVLQLSRSTVGPLGDRSLLSMPLEVEAGQLLLLRSYMLAALRHGRNGPVPGVVGQHLRELVATTFLPVAHRRGPEGLDARTATRLQALRDCIARGYADPTLSMAQVAAQVGLSERSGYLAFRMAACRFSEELTAVRLRAAAAQLRTGATRVLDVAYAVGFNDVSYFNKCFRALYGCTPSELRQHPSRARLGLRQRGARDAVPAGRSRPEPPDART